MSDERICGGPSDSPWRDEEQDATEEPGGLDGYHPMVRDFILGQGCFSQEAQIEAAQRVGEKIGKAAAKALNDALVEQFAPRPPLTQSDVVNILAEGDRRCREIESTVAAKALKAQFEAIDKKWDEVAAKTDASPSDQPLFSRRKAMADAAVKWCDDAGADRSPLNIVTALCSLGLVVAARLMGCDCFRERQEGSRC